MRCQLTLVLVPRPVNGVMRGEAGRLKRTSGPTIRILVKAAKHNNEKKGRR